MLAHSIAAYEVSAARNPHYIEWLKLNPQFKPQLTIA
jgi:hypothetical protein